MNTFSRTLAVLVLMLAILMAGCDIRPQNGAQAGSQVGAGLATSPAGQKTAPLPASPAETALPAPAIQVTSGSGQVGPAAGQPEAGLPVAAPASTPGDVQPPAPEPANPAPAPTVPVLRQLTSGGCCVQPFWSPDSRQVLFLDRPTQDAPTGFYAVSVDGGPAALWTDRLGIFSPDLSLRAFPNGRNAVIERLADGQQWVIANGGRSVSFSPDSRRVAWSSGQSGPPFDTAQRQIWVANVDGSEARRVLEVVGGGFSGWMPDGRIMISGRADPPGQEQVLWAVTLPSAPGEAPQKAELARAERLRSLSVSPDGRFMAYVVSFTQDQAQDGLWVVDLGTGARRKLDVFGSFRWRDGNTLLLIPLEPGRPEQRLVEIDAASGETVPLTLVEQTPFRIGNGDWSVSPDGHYIVFLSASDNNLWLIELPAD